MSDEQVAGGGSVGAPAASEVSVPSMDEYVASRASRADAPAPEQQPEKAAEPGTADEAPKEQPADAQQQQQHKQNASRMQRRFNELTRAREEASRAQAAAEERAQELERQVSMLVDLAKGGQRPDASQGTQGKPGVDRAPTEEDFPGDYRAFLRAESRWEARQEFDARAAQMREQYEAQQTQAQQQVEHRAAMERVGQFVRDYEGRVGEYAAAHPEYLDVTSALDDIPLNEQTGAMAQAVMMRRDSAEIWHALAQHPDVARQIASLPAHMQGVAIGDFAARFQMRKQSSAPPPGSPVAARNSGTGGALPPAGSSMDDYAAARMRAMQKG